MRFTTLGRVTIRAMWGWWHDNCLRLAVSLAFYTALSLAPLVIIVVGLAGLVTEPQQVVQQLATESERLMGLAGRQVVEIILTTTEPQGGILATLTGVLTLLLGATAVFGELAAVLNLSPVHDGQGRDRRLYRPRGRRISLWRRRVADRAVSMGLLLGIDRLFRRRVHAGLDDAPAGRAT